MSPVVIDVSSAQDSRDVVHRAVQALAEGKLVAIPTETVYGLAASALNADAVQHLIDVKQRQAGHALTLAIKSADDALDYVPSVCDLSRRLARRCWPGPVTLVLKDSHRDSLIHQLPESVQRAIVPNGTIGMRVPGHQLILDILRLMPGPLALTSANRTGQDPPITAEDVVAGLEEGVELVLDDGRSQFGQASSVIQVTDGQIKILREGVVSSSALHRLSSFMVLLVCTGNTCRSPMAEALCRQRIAAKIGCSMDELEDHGVVVMSAGIAAMQGGCASPEAVDVLTERDIDITDHVAQPLTDRLVNHSDVILTMTRGHRQAIVSHFPGAAARTHLLCGDTDVADPIGGPRELYSRCANQIDKALEQRISEFEPSLKPRGEQA